MFALGSGRGGEGVFLVAVVGDDRSAFSPVLLLGCSATFALEESSAAFLVSPLVAGSNFGPAIFNRLILPFYRLN